MTPDTLRSTRTPLRLLQVGIAIVASMITVVTSVEAGPPAVTGVISTAAGTGTAGVGGDGGVATAAQLNGPTSTAVDAAGNVYIADQTNHRIRRIAAGSGLISTFAGTGVAGFLGDGGAATAARLYFPTGVAVDAAGNVYIADQYNNRIRMVTAATGLITTVAGNGVGGFSGDGGLAQAAQLNRPTGIVVAASGNFYIADAYSHHVRKVTAATGIITTLAGTGTPGYNGDGPAASANLYYPWGVAVDGAENVYIADLYNHRVRKVAAATGVISTIAGTASAGFGGEGGPGTAARLYYPAAVASDVAGTVYVADQYNHRIRKVHGATGVITTVAGSGTAAFGGDGGEAPAGLLLYPQGVALSASGALYIADTNNHRVRMVSSPSFITRAMATFAGTGTAGYNGDGPATGVNLYYPYGVAVDAQGNAFIADQYNHRIRMVAAATGVLSTVAGTGVAGYNGDGPATTVRLYYPSGLATDGVGNVYIADQYNHRVRKITLATGALTTIAGTGAAGSAGDNGQATIAQLNYPHGVALDSANNLYIADYQNHKVRRVSAATGVITTIAGTGTAGVAGDGGLATAGQLNSPASVAVDGSGNVYIADTSNHRIRKVTAATGVISTVAGGANGFQGENDPAATAKLSYPTGVAVDAAGDVYIADQLNDRIRKISAATGIIATVAGSGTVGFGGDGSVATAAQLNRPTAVAVDGGGNLLIADQYNHRVRRASFGLAAPFLTVSRLGGTTAVSLNWTASSGATGYSVKRGTAPGGAKVELIRTANTSYVDTGLAFDTTYYYLVSAISPTDSANSNEVAIRLGRGAVISDFDGDRKTDVAIFRPSTGQWFVRQSGTNTLVTLVWGGGADKPVAGDYDGDGLMDVAVFRPSTGQWFVRHSSTAALVTLVWGGGSDIPVQADYDGDAITDIAIFRPSTGQWFVRPSTTFLPVTLIWGGGTDIPVPADYDGDGKTDIAIFRPTTGEWFVRQSSTFTLVTLVWGGGTDKPVPGDYDGDGKTDIAVFRPSTGQWFVRPSTTFVPVTLIWGGGADVPVPGDYDGDGKFDIAIFRPSTGQWFVRQSSTFTVVTLVWGGGGDIPIMKRP